MKNFTQKNPIQKSLTCPLVVGLALITLPAAVHAAPSMQDPMMKPLTFKSLEAPTQGSVNFQKNPDGTYTLQIMDLDTEAAPDLRVWLYKKTVHKAKDVKKNRNTHVVVAELKNFKGDFSFKLPEGTDPAQFKSVVLWCDLVSVPFAAVNLQ